MHFHNSVSAAAGAAALVVDWVCSSQGSFCLSPGYDQLRVCLFGRGPRASLWNKFLWSSMHRKNRNGGPRKSSQSPLFQADTCCHVLPTSKGLEKRTQREWPHKLSNLCCSSDGVPNNHKTISHMREIATTKLTRTVSTNPGSRNGAMQHKNTNTTREVNNVVSIRSGRSSQNGWMSVALRHGRFGGLLHLHKCGQTSTTSAVALSLGRPRRCQRLLSTTSTFHGVVPTPPPPPHPPPSLSRNSSKTKILGRLQENRSKLRPNKIRF